MYEPIASHERDSIEENAAHDEELDTYFSDQKVHIPNREGFSFRKLWAFTGPGFLMSIAYLDPGNIEADLESGSIAEYRLLWVLLTSTICGLLMQRLAARLGTVSGLHLAEACYKQYKKWPRLLLWIMMEIAIIGSDMQEVIGTAISIYLLSQTAIPLWGGTLLAIVDAFAFLMLEKFGIRKLEMLFGFLITVMAVTFGYEYVVADPEHMDVLDGIFVPWGKKYESKDLFQAVGMIGAVIMPHNLYLHSALVKSRDIDRKDRAKVRDANKYFFIESSIALLVSFLISVFVVSVFAHGLYDKKNIDVLKMCRDNQSSLYEEAKKHFPNDTNPVEADLYKGGIFLGCSFGTFALYIWAIGILAAGSSSTMTGTYAGQFAMEGFLHLNWPRWKRVLVTRTVAIVPTFFVAYFSKISDLTQMNDTLNAIMSLQLPFAILPTIALTSSVPIMGEFVNSLFSKILATLICTAIVIVNSVLVVFFIEKADLNREWFIPIGIGCIFYIMFVIYLVVHTVVYMSGQHFFRFSFVKKYVLPTENMFGDGLTNAAYTRLTD